MVCSSEWEQLIMELEGVAYVPMCECEVTRCVWALAAFPFGPPVPRKVLDPSSEVEYFWGVVAAPEKNTPLRGAGNRKTPGKLSKP